MFRGIFCWWGIALPIFVFFVTPQVYADHSCVPTIEATPNLLKQQELYSKYFMDGTRNGESDADVWNDFLSQPHGIAEGQRDQNGRIISLASHPSCISTTWLSIESLMRQEIKPARIILNLYESEFPDKSLPWTLQQQVKRGLEINWVENDAKIDVPLTRSDILHPSPLIHYFVSHAHDELVIIPYNAHIPLAPDSKNKMDLKEAETLAFEDVFGQFKALGGELKYLVYEGLPTNHVHNPSIIEFNGKTFMTARVQCGKPGMVYEGKLLDHYYSETFFAEVDSNYTFKNAYRIIEDTQRTHEDARLTVSGDSLFISYVSDMSHQANKMYRHCVEVAKFEPGQQIKSAIRPAIENNLSIHCHQKNWLYFEKDGSFLVINNIDPFEVWDCTHSLENPIPLGKKSTAIQDWKYGHIRASTTPIYLEEHGVWLVFFHSHLMTQDSRRLYYLGALAFDNDFNITAYTDKPILVSTAHIKCYINANTILPYGCIRKDDDLILSLGINDSKAAIGRLPLNRVMELLKVV